MIGVSGCGKTRTIYEYLCCRFGFYFVADTQGNGGSPDVMLARTLIEEAILQESFFTLSRDTLDALLLAWFIVVDICLSHRPSMTPYEWLLIQTSLWTTELEQAFRIATTLSSNTSEPLIVNFLKLFQDLNQYCLPVFMDEAQISMGNCVGKFQSRTEGVYRTLFSKVASTFGYFTSMLTIFGGTGLGLKDVRELLLSYIGKDAWSDVHFTDFTPFCTVEEVLPYFSVFVGVNKVEPQCFTCKRARPKRTSQHHSRKAGAAEYEQRVAYALYYFFEAQGRPFTNKLVDYLGVTHKLDPSAAGFMFERFIAPKVVSWLKSSSTLGAHEYFNLCRDTLQKWSREAVVDTSEPVMLETSRDTGKSLLLAYDSARESADSVF